MTTMRLPLRSVILAAPVLLGALFAACGGGGGGEPAGSNGDRIVDPDRVATATPMGKPDVFKISGDTITPPEGAASALTPVAGSAIGTGTTSYKVLSGDTCGAIASKHNISLDALLKANRTIDANCGNLQAGDTLRIPGAAASAAPTAGSGGGLTSNPTARPSGRTHTVKSGDTCEAIARNQGVKVQDLIAKNGLDSNCQTLKIDQVLQIP